MRKTKRFAAAVAALAMAVSMVAASSTMTAFAEDPTYSITITNQTSDKGAHTYKYVQLLTGEFEGNIISNAAFSTAFAAKKAEIATALNGLRSNEPEFADLTDESSAEAFAKAISALNNKAEDVAKVLKANLAASAATTDTITGGTAKNVGAAGYYLIFDDTNSPAASTPTPGVNSGAKTEFILKVINDTTVNVNAKASAPTVDKQVEDNNDGTVDEGFDNGGYGETADHAIGEEFNFKLTAKIPNEDYINDYTKYSLRFVDTIDSSIDFVAIESVKINGTDIASRCVTDFNAEKKNGEGYFYIDDIKLGDNTADIKNATVEIIYSAKLNETAKVAGTAADINKNKVKLEYSNNPNYTGNGELGSNTTDGNGEKNEKGQTPEDTVGVYTYKILNKKVDKDTQQPLYNAQFKLTKTNDKNAEGIKFTFDSEMNAYIPDSNGGAEITSVLDGTFNIIGLDAGTYYLFETAVPTSADSIPYNQLTDPVVVTITANHKETTDTANPYVLEMNEGYGTENKVENVKGAELPETGGIGTTMFYVGGGALAAVAGTVLIAKKRAKKED